MLLKRVGYGLYIIMSYSLRAHWQSLCMHERSVVLALRFQQSDSRTSVQLQSKRLSISTNTLPLYSFFVGLLHRTSYAASQHLFRRRCRRHQCMTIQRQLCLTSAVQGSKRHGMIVASGSDTKFAVYRQPSWYLYSMDASRGACRPIADTS